MFVLKPLADLQLDGVEFSTLPSGLHLVDQDVVYVLLSRPHFPSCIHRHHMQLLHKRQSPRRLCISPSANYGTRTTWIQTFLSGHTTCKFGQAKILETRGCPQGARRHYIFVFGKQRRARARRIRLGARKSFLRGTQGSEGESRRMEWMESGTR